MKFGKRRNCWAYKEGAPWSPQISFAVMDHDLETGAGTIGAPITMVPHPEGERFTAPTFTLMLEEAQELMDSLWQVGLRPSEGTGSAGSLAATQKHLEDMRWLVMKGHGPK